MIVDLTWEAFIEMVFIIFSNLEGKNLIVQFNKLKQDIDVTGYTLKFEELKTFMVSADRNLSEEYFVHSCLSGLKVAIMLEIFNPSTLNEAIKLAKKQELMIIYLGRGLRQFSKNLTSSGENGGRTNHRRKWSKI